MTKFKIFMGTIDDKADKKANEWIEKNPDIVLYSYQYQQARYSDHSICIMYEEKDS